MRNWLRDRGQTVPAADATHHRMKMNGVEHDMLMPGMLTDEQMAALDKARGPGVRSAVPHRHDQAPPGRDRHGRRALQLVRRARRTTMSTSSRPTSTPTSRSRSIGCRRCSRVRQAHAAVKSSSPVSFHDGDSCHEIARLRIARGHDGRGGVRAEVHGAGVISGGESAGHGHHAGQCACARAATGRCARRSRADAPPAAAPRCGAGRRRCAARRRTWSWRSRRAAAAAPAAAPGRHAARR